MTDLAAPFHGNNHTDSHRTSARSFAVRVLHLRRRGAMVRGEVNGVVTFYAGRHYHQEVDGVETTVRKFYLLGSMTIAVRTMQGTADTLNWILGDHFVPSDVLREALVMANEDESWNSILRYTAFGKVRASQGLMPTEYRYTG